MELSCSLRIRAAFHKKNFLESHIIILLLTKLVQSRWLDTGHVLFCMFINTQKAELGQYLVILTSLLVNNPSIYRGEHKMAPVVEVILLPTPIKKRSKCQHNFFKNPKKIVIAIK